MNIISVSFLLVILVGCAAQDPVPNRPSVFIQTQKEGCSFLGVRSLTRCACFVFLFVSPPDVDIRERCRGATGVDVDKAQTFCDPFLIENETNYNFSAIIESVNDTKERCFGEQRPLRFPPGSLLNDLMTGFEIPFGDLFFDILGQLCKRFE